MEVNLQQNKRCIINKTAVLLFYLTQYSVGR